MAVERTLGIIKPDAVEQNKIGGILAMVEEGGLTIKAMKLVRLSRPQAEGFYAVHKERPFFGELIEFMTRGPVVVMALEAEGAVKKWRDLMGATNPEEAAEGTIRQEVRNEHRRKRHPRIGLARQRPDRSELLLPGLRAGGLVSVRGFAPPHSPGDCVPAAARQMREERGRRYRRPGVALHEPSASPARRRGRPGRGLRPLRRCPASIGWCAGRSPSLLVVCWRRGAAEHRAGAVRCRRRRVSMRRSSSRLGCRVGRIGCAVARPGALSAVQKRSYLALSKGGALAFLPDAPFSAVASAFRTDARGRPGAYTLIRTSASREAVRRYLDSPRSGHRFRWGDEAADVPRLAGLRARFLDDQTLAIGQELPASGRVGAEARCLTLASRHSDAFEGRGVARRERFAPRARGHLPSARRLPRAHRRASGIDGARLDHANGRGYLRHPACGAGADFRAPPALRPRRIPERRARRPSTRPIDARSLGGPLTRRRGTYAGSAPAEAGRRAGARPATGRRHRRARPRRRARATAALGGANRHAGTRGRARPSRALGAPGARDRRASARSRAARAALRPTRASRGRRAPR